MPRRRRSPPKKGRPPKKGKKGTPNKPGSKSGNTERAVVLSYVKRLKGDFKTGKDAAASLQSPVTFQGWGKGHGKWLDGPEGKTLMMERNNTQKHPGINRPTPLGAQLTPRIQTPLACPSFPANSAVQHCTPISRDL